MQDEVSQDYREQNEVDGMKKGDDSTGKVMHISKVINIHVINTPAYNEEHIKNNLVSI